MDPLLQNGPGEFAVTGTTPYWLRSAGGTFNTAEYSTTASALNRLNNSHLVSHHRVSLSDNGDGHTRDMYRPAIIMYKRHNYVCHGVYVCVSTWWLASDCLSSVSLSLSGHSFLLVVNNASASFKAIRGREMRCQVLKGMLCWHNFLLVQ